MKLTNIIKFSQRDPKWANEKLGTSSVTLGGYGCAVTALAMVENYYGFVCDPSTLNKLLIEKGCYLDRNLMKWWDIQKVNEFVKTTDWIDCPTTPAPIIKVDAELTAGRPVIIWVDVNPMEAGDQMHFVVIVGKTEDGHYIINDPWTGEEYFLDAKYGEAKEAIHGLRLINGPVPQPEAPKPDIAGLNQQIETLKQQMDDVRDALRPTGVMPGNDVSDVTKSIVELISIKNQYNDHLKQDEVNLEKPDHKHEGWDFKTKWEIKNWLIEFWEKG